MQTKEREKAELIRTGYFYVYVTAFSKLNDLAYFCEKSMQSHIHTRTKPGNIFTPKKVYRRGKATLAEGIEEN